MSAELLSFPETFNGADRFVDWNVQEGRGDKVAIYYFDEQITYNQLLENVNRTGNSIKYLGLGLEARIAILTFDCPQFVYAFFGAQRAGAVPIILSTRLTPKDYLYMLNDSQAQVIFVSNELYPLIAEIKKELSFLKIIIVVSDRTDGGKADKMDYITDFDRWIVDFPPISSPVPTQPDAIAFGFYPSDSAGEPELISYSHHAVVYDAEYIGKRHLQMTENDITYSAVELSLGYGLQNSVFFPFYVGGATVLYPGRLLPDQLMKVVAQYRSTMFFGLPDFYNRLLQIPDLTAKYDLGSLRSCVSGGESLPGPIQEKWREVTGVEVVDSVGIGNKVGEAKPD